MPVTAEHHMTAFLDGPDDPGIANPIHSSEVASTYGYRAALVGGVTVYGWCVPAILDVLSEAWLDRGWAEVAFRRPVYAGDALAITAVEQGHDGEFRVTNESGATCIAGSAGLGDAGWLADVLPPAMVPVTQPPGTRPQLTLASAPIGANLHPMVVPAGSEAMAEYASALQRDDHPRWQGDRPRLHPAWLAARMAPLLRHNFSFGPSIHARGQLQHMAPAFGAGPVTVRARLTEAFERNGHHYALLDGLVTADDGTDLLRVRHTTIFRPAKREA